MPLLPAASDSPSVTPAFTSMMTAPRNKRHTGHAKDMSISLQTKNTQKKNKITLGIPPQCASDTPFSAGAQREKEENAQQASKK